MSDENVKNITFTDYIKGKIPNNIKYADEKTKEIYSKKIGFIKQKNDTYKFNPTQFARFFHKHINLALINNTEQLAIYNNSKGHYELDSDIIISRLIMYFMNLVQDFWDVQYDKSALAAIKRLTKNIVTKFNIGSYINLKNGILNLEDFEMYSPSPKYFCTYQLPFEYTQDRYTPIFDTYLSDITCGDTQLQMVLQEIAGYTLCNSTAAEKAFLLIGNGANGKSVYTKIIQMLVGKDNFSSTTLSELNGTFGLSSLINSNVNIVAENGDEKFNSEKFKAIVSGDTVEVNRKYKEPLTVALHTKLIFSFNSLPESTDLSYGFLRKLLIVPFNRTFRGTEIDVNLFKKIQLEASGVFNWALEGLKRLKDNHYVFTKSTACEEALEAYKKDLNPVAKFFEQNFIFDSSSKVKKSNVYTLYLEHCENNSESPVNIQKFWKLIKFYYIEIDKKFIVKKVRGIDHLDGIALNNTKYRKEDNYAKFK